MSGDIIEQLSAIVGSGRIICGAAVAEREFPWATHETCEAIAIVFPETTQEVSGIEFNEQPVTVTIWTIIDGEFFSKEYIYQTFWM